MRNRQAYVILHPTGSLNLSFPTFRSRASRDRFAIAAPSLSAEAQRKRIMVVDDEVDISIMFKSGLERGGYVVDVFNDPLQALSYFKPEYYDLLLLDVRMPKMSGFELCSQLRKQDKTAKVCFISAFEIHEEEMKKYLLDEVEKCIVKKPVSMKELVRIIGKEMSGMG